VDVTAPVPRPLWRCRRVETSSPRNHLHAFRIERPDDVDAEFVAWLREAYAVGEQRHFGGERTL
jgi:hypothetical protein